MENREYSSVTDQNKGVFNILTKTLAEKKKGPIQPEKLEEMISKIGKENDLNWSDIEEEADILSQGCGVSKVYKKG